MTPEVLFAFSVGAVATANPCGFPLLPAYLARRVGADTASSDVAGAVVRAFALGVAASLGFLVVFAGVGTAVALGARGLATALPWVGFTVGLVLVVAGAFVLAGGRVALPVPAALGSARDSGLGGDFAFGLGYGAASLGCTLPMFLGVIGTASTGSSIASAASFVAYALGMGTILTGLAVAAALSRSGLARSIRGAMPHVRRVSGAIVALAGLYVTYYWGSFVLATPTGREPLVAGGGPSRPPSGRG